MLRTSKDVAHVSSRKQSTGEQPGLWEGRVMTAGTARILSGSSSLSLPAETSYDRQLLVEHVRSCVRGTPQVEVRVDDTTWLIAQPVSPLTTDCGGCAQRITQVACRHPRSTMVYCVRCALGRPQLTLASLSHLPEDTVLRDVQAHYAFGGEWIPWTRWPQATPAEIIEDMRLQRRFAPVLVWRCAEIRRGQAAMSRGGPSQSPQAA